MEEETIDVTGTIKCNDIYKYEDNIEKILDHAKVIISNSTTNFNKDLETNNECNTDLDNEDKTSYFPPECKNDINLITKNEEFGVKELLIIVEEFERLRDKYISLEKDVKISNANKKEEEDQVSILSEVDDLKKEVDVLKEDNQRLKLIIDEQNSNKDKTETTHNDLNQALQKTIERLEEDLKSQRNLTNEAVEKLSAHDAAAKRAISVIKKEMGGRIDQVTKMHQELLSEKDAYIIKISKLEQHTEELQQKTNVQNRKLAENQGELDNLRGILKSKDSEYIKLIVNNEALEKEITQLNKKIETHTNDIDAQDMKVKWAQNKLKLEMDAHKETKKQITQLTTKLQQAKEEGNQIRQNCQEMIERYQGDEEITSVRLNKELEEEKNNLKKCAEEIAKLEQKVKNKDKEMGIVKNENISLTKELFDQKSLVTMLEGKNSNLTFEIREREKDCAEYKTTLDDLKDQVKDINEMKVVNKNYAEELTLCKDEIEQLKKRINEYEIEINEHKAKQEEIISFSQNLTESNVSSKAMTTDLQLKLDTLMKKNNTDTEKLLNSEKEYKVKINTLLTEKHQLETNIQELSKLLEEKSNTINGLTDSLEEYKDQLKVLKKKNASQMKDLQRQLHQTTRKIEKLESTSKNGSMENLSIRSRTSSNNSLEKMHSNDSPPNHSSSPQFVHEPVLIPQDHNVIQPSSNRQQYQEIEVDKKVLFERICKLQRINAKKSEKLDFMDEHINHLTEELQKKSKIIQYYVSREEAGSLAPDRFDRNKADLTQHGGIMASVYSARPTDKGMTLELSLTINKKLQAVLEDTILKNIMLKENINTLGMEIAKLQEELKTAKIS